MANAPADVIEVLSSDDDDVVVVDCYAGRKRCREGLRNSSRIAGPIDTATLEREFGDHSRPRKNDETRSSYSAASVPIVLDDDGSDNAVITYGLMELADDLTASRASQCACSANLGRSRVEIEGLHRNSTVVQIKQNDEWSCGFRNLQMMLSAILPHFPASHSYFHKNPRRSNCTLIPTVRQIQLALEQSWKAGFDQRAAKHYRNMIVGKTAWIGAAEVTSLLSFWGIDATLVQFVTCSQSRMLLPKFVKAYFAKQVGRHGCPFCCSSDEHMTSQSKAEVLRRLVEADGGGGQLETPCSCPCLPLYLQWEGHSVTIVGIETVRSNRKKKYDFTYLVLDPLKEGSKLRDGLLLKKTLDTLRLDSNRLLQKDAQLVMCSFRPLSPNEREREVKSITAAKEAVKRALAKSCG